MDPKRPNSRRPTEIIAGNDDLLMEIILLRLPARSLLRFQSVSKHWQSLITAPSFAHQHTNNHRRRRQPPPSFIFRSISQKHFHFNPTTKTLRPRIMITKYPHSRILQSTNGLMLLECRKSKYGKKLYKVYNPTTRRRSATIIDGGNRSNKGISGISLVFDPSKSPHYKVLFVRGNCLDIYDSQSRKWNYRKHMTPPVKMKFPNGIYRNNGIYSIRHSSKSHYFDLDHKIVNNLPKIKTPWRRTGETNKNYVMESNGHLHCVSIYWGPDFKSLFVFELSEDNSGWFDKYKVDLGPISSVLPEENRPIEVVGIVRGEGEEDSSVLLHSPGRIIRYTFSDGGFEVLLDFRRGSKICKQDQLQFRGHFCYQFVESLAAV